MKENYIIALDQGTTSSRAILFDKETNMRAMIKQPLPQLYPNPGWVEQDPREILSSQLGALTHLLVSEDIKREEIDSIGITNQRETTIVWNRETGMPIYNALVWQCRRTADIVEEVCADPQVAATITKKTGLIPDAYFSASKIKWLLDTVEGAREDAEAGKLCFGTVDTWLIWALTDGHVHATDYTNASRTMLFDIHSGTWDPWLCELFDVPMVLLPEVRPSSSSFGVTAHPGVISGVPICGVAGDQQAALFGQCCFEKGEAKNTYGTGCFLLMHTGDNACVSKSNLITTIAASAPEVNHLEYALEGSVFTAGALIQWLRDELGILKTVEESEQVAKSITDNAGVYIVPAFTGLGAPYWDAEARGTICGLTRGAGRAHIVRAALESLAYQVNDLVRAMEVDAGVKMNSLNADGGASSNDFLMQFQSDILDASITRQKNIESTALGAACLAGLASGFWKNADALRKFRTIDRVFESEIEAQQRKALLSGWEEALKKTRSS